VKVKAVTGNRMQRKNSHINYMPRFVPDLTLAAPAIPSDRSNRDGVQTLSPVMLGFPAKLQTETTTPLLTYHGQYLR
jgi:hypothetical protein